MENLFESLNPSSLRTSCEAHLFTPVYFNKLQIYYKKLNKAKEPIHRMYERSFVIFICVEASFSSHPLKCICLTWIVIQYLLWGGGRGSLGLQPPWYQALWKNSTDI